MTTGIPDSLERLTQADLIGVVRELIGEVGRLRAENEKLSGALTKLKTEHQAIRDELARLKNLPPRPPQKPSGMDKATDRGGSGGKSAKGEKSSRRRGSQLDKLTIDATVVVRAKAPAGSRHKGYEEIVVQDLNLSPQVTRYRRERWETPEGETIIAALDPGIVGGYGPNLHRLLSLSKHPGAAFLRTSHLRADRRASPWHGRGDFKAASRALADGQARDLPRRGRSGVESRPRRRLCHGRRHRRAPRRPERLHHTDRLRYLHGVSHRPE